MNKIKVITLLALFVFISFKFSSEARGVISSLSNSVIRAYLGSIEHISNMGEDHLFQKKSIRDYREQVESLSQSAQLSVAVASKLNSYLQEINQSAYDPKLSIVEAISYANLSDYNRVWLDFKDFDCSKIYGLVHQGSSAGIAICQDGKPLGLLNGDDKSIYSVLVGESEIPGVATGDDEFIHVKYIPMWMEPQVGDEVITSGKDKIFFKGVPVGKVVEVIKVDSYQSVLVKPSLCMVDLRILYALIILSGQE